MDHTILILTMETALSSRITAARSVFEAFRQTSLTEEDVSTVIVAIDRLIEDPEQTVRAELLEQLPQIALFCHQHAPYLGYVIQQHILPNVVKLLKDKFGQVRKMAQSGLLTMVENGVISPSQVEELVCPVILDATHHDAHEEFRTEIPPFMSKLAPLLGTEITVKFYLERFRCLCNDSLFQVRKVCAVSIGDIAAVIGTNLTEKFLTTQFKKLCGDEVWGVRKACAEVFTSFASMCRMDTRRDVLTQLFMKLLQDSSRWVRIAAFQSLGSYITTFIADESPPSTPQLSEVEKKFMEGLPSISPDFSLGQDNINNNIESMKEDNDNSLSQSSVISQCPTQADSSVDTDNNSQPTAENNQNLITTDYNADFPSLNESCQRLATNSATESMEMEVDETGEELDLEVRMIASGDQPFVSFEEDRKLVYEYSANDILTHNEPSLPHENDSSNSHSSSSSDTLDKNNEENGQTVHKLTEAFLNAHVSQNPSASISSTEKGSVLHIHAEQESMLSSTNSAAKAALSSDSSMDSYNTWQFWRPPIPEIEVDVDLHENGEQQIKVRAVVEDPINHTTYSSDFSLNVLKERKTEGKKELTILRGSGDEEIGRGDLKEYSEVTQEVTEGDSKIKLEINTTSSSTIVQHQPDCQKVAVLDSSVSSTTIDIPSGNLLGIHRSYMNLYNATRDDEDGMEMKIGDNGYDDDSDEQLSASYPFGDEYPSGGWTAKSARPRLLGDLPVGLLSQNQSIVPEPLLQQFTSMCKSSSPYQSLDTELPSYCVFNLPAVALTLGPQNWSLLRECYEDLACNMQWKIRYTLASSLHEIAKILGPDLADRDLVPFYNATVKDVDEVRIGVLRNLSEFIMTLGPESRRKCLETLSRFVVTENTRNWRFRLELAEQIGKLAEMFDADEIHKHLCPVSMDLIVDRVSEVRKEALKVVTGLVKRLNNSYNTKNPVDSSLVREFLRHLVKTLGHSDQWVRRQVFGALAGELIKNESMSPSQFAQDILTDLINLSNDKVPNVRLKVAQSLYYCVISIDYFKDYDNPHREILLNTLSKLQADPDCDVRFFSSPATEECDEEEEDNTSLVID